MKKKFRLKVSKWKNGVLEHLESEHESMQEALLEAELHEGVIKIYSELNQLIHVEHRLKELIKEIESYA